MSDVKHTPGPWEFDPENYGVCNHPGYGLLDANGDSIGVTVHERDVSGRVYSSAASNARLIAAAPDLLEACRAALELEHCDCLKESYIRCVDCMNRMTQIDAAIVKATGAAATVGGGQ